MFNPQLDKYRLPWCVTVIQTLLRLRLQALEFKGSLVYIENPLRRWGEIYRERQKDRDRETEVDRETMREAERERVKCEQTKMASLYMALPLDD